MVGILFLLGGAGQQAAGQQDEPGPPLRVMSFNIRYDNPADGPNAWPKRRDLVGQVIRFHETDLLGVQEGLEHQVRQLAEDLPGFAWVGVGRGDGEAAGEFSPIFYREERFELLESGTFWLSPTPDDPGSRGWDAALPRIATWARLRDRRAGREFLALNTHFDHLGEQARQESARLIVEKAATLAGREGALPIVVLGDFNADPASQTYATLAEAFEDARERSEGGHFGPDGTFGTFQPQEAPGERIDYIFVRGKVRVIREATLAHHWNGRHASDHWPVFAELRWE